MEIEKLDLDVKTYNRLKRDGINTTGELLCEMYKGGEDITVSTPDAKKCEAALKDAGIIKYMRGDYVTEEDIEPDPLTWDELHSYIGKLVVFDCSTESHRWLKVNWIFDIKDDGEGTAICSDGSRDYSYIRRNTVNRGYYQKHDPEYLSRHEHLKNAGHMFALKSEEVKAVPQTQVMSADYTKAVTLTKRIKANAAAAQESLWEVCKGLNEVRNGQLYKELGYQNFDRYCKGEIGLTPQQGRKYAAIASLAKLENGKSTFSFETIGTEKLYLLAKLDEHERTEIAQNTDLENTSVKELKAKIDDLKKANDRLMGKVDEAEKKATASRKSEEAACGKLSIISTNLEMQQQKTKQLEEKNASLEAQVKELEERPVEVAVQANDAEIDKLTAQFQEELAKRDKDTERRLEEQRKRHAEEMRKQREQLEKEAEAADVEVEEEIREKAELEMHIKFVTDAMRKLAHWLFANDPVGENEYRHYAAKKIEEVSKIITKEEK